MDGNATYRERTALRWSRNSSVRIHHLVALWLVSALPAGLSASNGRACGKVIDESGEGIEEALVVASGVGLRGWATTQRDGSFCVVDSGEFISARHAGFNPTLIASSALARDSRIRLAKADAAVRTLPSCESFPAKGRAWIGGSLRVKPAGRHKGPVHGGHDAHWYITFKGSSLHIVDGYAWHSGLPLESLLSSSSSIDIHGWEFGEIVGLDLVGQLRNGQRWRWLGASVAEAISYENASPEQAEYFDRILNSICFAAR